MFDRIFEKLQFETNKWIEFNRDYLISNIGKSVEEFFQIPEPAAPFELIRRFEPSSDRILTRGGISVEGNAWRIEACEKENASSSSDSENNSLNSVRKVVLFELPDPKTSERVLACRALIKIASLNEKASFDLYQIGNASDLAWLSDLDWLKGTISLGRNVFLPAGDRDWSIYEVRQHFKKTNTPGKIKIELDFKSSGIIWIRNIDLLQAPVSINKN